MMGSTIFYTMEKYFNVVCLAIFVFILAKELSPYDFGLLSNADAIIAILCIFSMQGIDQLVQREIVNEKISRLGIYSTVMMFKLFSILISFLILAFLVCFYTDQVFITTLLILSVFIPLRALLFINCIFVCHNRYKEFFVIGFTVSIGSLVIKLYLTYTYGNYFLLVALMLLDSLVLILVYSFFYIREFGFRFELNKSMLDIIMKEGVFLIFSAGMIVIYTRVDQLFIGEMLGPEILANYSLTLKFINIFILASTVFTLSYVPRLKKDTREYPLVIKRMMIESFVFSIFVCIFCLIVTPRLIEFFYGVKYQLAIDLSYIFPLIIPFAFLLSTTGRILVLEGLSRAVFKRNLYALIINVVLNYFLITWLGAIGAIYASIFSFFISSFLYLLLNRDTRKFFIRIF